MLKKRDIGILFTIAIPSMAALSLHFYLGSMSRFLADDYCEAYIAQHFGLLRSIWYWYISWDGAFTDSIIDWFLVLIKTGGIPFITPVVLSIWVVVTAAAIYLFLPPEYSFLSKVSTSLAIGSLAVFVTLLISPNVPESLYWWTGMRSYILPLVIFTFYWFLHQWIKINWKSKYFILWSILSFGVVFLIGGLSETFTPVLCVLFIGWVTLGLLTKKLIPPNKTFFLIFGGLLGVLTSLIVMIAAPGNAVRQTLYQTPPSIIGILNISTSSFILFISNILIKPEKIAGILGVALASFWLGLIFDNKYKIRLWMAPAVLLAGIALTIGCFLPSAYGLSDSPPDRTLSIPSFILIATILISGFTTGSLLSFYITPHQLDGIRSGLLIIILASLGFSAWVNVHNLYSSRQAFIDFAIKWDTVDKQIIQAKLAGKEVVHIPALDSWTTLDRPRDKTWFWQNICYSNYYGIQILGP